MENSVPEIANPRPNWDVEKRKVEKALVQKYEVGSRTPQLRNILLLAKGLYDITREQAQPFMDALFDEGSETYFSRLSSAAYLLNETMSPKKGGTLPDKTLEQLTDEAAIGIINDLADMFDQREKLKTQGLTEKREGLGRRWEQIDIEKPDLINSIEDFDKAIQEAIESGASQTAWLMGLRVIQAKLHNQLNILEKNIRAKRPEIQEETTEAEKANSLNPEDVKVVNEKSSQIAMTTIDDIELALPEINKYEWRKRFQEAQGKFVEFLETQGISTLVPKVGDAFDRKWQMAIGSHGQGNRITKVVRDAFIDKSKGHVIQDAWVEV